MTNRWWIYQRERFPLAGHGPLILSFSASAVALSALLRGGWPSWPAVGVAFASALLAFFELRVSDEFKDADEDRQFRPYRPVPRGLVTLPELARLGIASMAVQLALAWWLDPRLIPVLAVAWAYMALLSREFFVAEWLKARPFTYLWTHMLIVPLIDLYATACDWVPAGATPPPGLGWFLGASFFNGVVVEVGRKLRAPADEEHGVETYSAAWGRPTAVAAWLVALGLAAACATMAARGAAVGTTVATIGLTAVLLAAGLGARFLQRLAPGSGKAFEIAAGVWTLTMYLSVGILPLVLKWWQYQ
ncbi:MAG: UbiA family prenyltransferase [Vicinamibacterales bacterium]